MSDIEIRTKTKEITENIGVGEDKFQVTACRQVENFKHHDNNEKGVFLESVSQAVPDSETFMPEEYVTKCIVAMIVC